MTLPTFHGTFSWFFFVPFLIFFLPFCWETGKTFRAIFFFEKTTGVIQDATYVPPSSDERGSHPSEQKVGTYTHQAVFQTPDGASHQIFTRVRSNPPSFNVGDSVPVRYSSQNPSIATIATFTELWLAPLALGFFTGVFFILWFGTWVGPRPSA